MLKLSLSIAILLVLFYGCGGDNNCCDGNVESVVNDVEKKGEPETVRFSPTPLISYSVSECMKGSTITFDARGSGDEDGHIVKYEWLMDGVVIASDPKPTFTCDKSGVKKLCLQVTDDDNLTSEPVCHNYTVKERVKIAPIAMLTNLPEFCTEGETILPYGGESSDSDGEIMEYKWSFADTNLSDINPKFICPKAGKYEICLEVIDNDELTDRNCSTIIAQEVPNSAPVAKIEALKFNCIVGESIELNASSSSDEDGEVIGYNWVPDSFTGENATFECDSTGEHIVCLSVIDDKGLSSKEVCQKIIVSKPANIPPVAKISGITDECVVGDKILADGSASTDSDGNVTGYLWSEDENTSASVEVKPIFECKKEGVKKICLSVTDNDGALSTNIECKEITIKPKQIVTIPPIAKINLGESTGDGIWFDCFESYDPDSVDGDNNAQNDGKIINHHWIVTKTLKNGDIVGPHESDNCPKWIGTPVDLDFMEVTLTVTDDDAEVTTITNIYDWDGEKLILR